MYMSHTRFELILQHIKYTEINPPTYKDRFWEVREMLEEWNKSMATNFVPSLTENVPKTLSKPPCLVAKRMPLTLHLLLFAQSM